MPAKPSLELLIVGSGPVGLTAALEAQRHGLTWRLIERKGERSTIDSRAVVVHPRVLEFLKANAQVVDKIRSCSTRTKVMAVHFGKSVYKAPMDDESTNWGDTDFAFEAFLPQYETESILEEALERKVEYGVTLEGLEQDKASATATIRHADGTVETVVAKYVVGCDGGRSKTRELIGVDMKRSRSKIYILVSDVKIPNFPWKEREFRLFTHPKGFCALFPLPEENEFRVVVLAPEGVSNKADVDMSGLFFEALLLERTALNLEVKVGWGNIFEVTHGVSDTFRKDHVFLAGDASHVHSPVGGQGMNYGIADAHNLLWKMAWAKRCALEDPNAESSVNFVLNSYNDERHSMGAELISAVEIMTRVVATRNRSLQRLRNLMLRAGLKMVDSGKRMRTVGEITLKYKPSLCGAILDSAGRGFVCQSGERLPNLRLEDGTHLHALVDGTKHTWVYLNSEIDADNHGTVVRAIPILDGQVSVPRIPQSHLQRSQVILVRPDLFVAGVDKTYIDLRKRLSEAGFDELVVACM